MSLFPSISGLPNLFRITQDSRQEHSQGTIFIVSRGNKKGGFVKGWLWRMCPRSRSWYGRTVFCTLVPVWYRRSVFIPSFRFWLSREHPSKPPFWKPPLCEPSKILCCKPHVSAEFAYLTTCCEDQSFGQSYFLLQRCGFMKGTGKTSGLDSPSLDQGGEPSTPQG